MRRWVFPLAAIAAWPATTHAGAGAYLVDDASITPAGQCQVQSWAQLVSGGQKALNSLPACSTGPVEWSLGVAAQNHPYQHQESPAVKWMARDPAKQALGVAFNAGVTWSNGHVLSRNGYVALTWTPDAVRRWAINADAGAIWSPQRRWDALLGLGLRYKLTDRLGVVVEHIHAWNGLSIAQAGVRWTFRNSDSVDVIVGRSNDRTHDRWLTLGLNFGL